MCLIGLQSIGFIYANMFITNNACRLPVSDLLEGRAQTYWAAAELALNQSWFLVTFSQTESIDDGNALEVGRTMLISNIADVEGLTQMGAEGQPRLDSVLIVTPSHVNGTDSWKMEPLQAVWMAEEPSVSGQVVKIYETCAGVKYARSMLGTPIEGLRNMTLRFRFPVPEKTSINTSH